MENSYKQRERQVQLTEGYLLAKDEDLKKLTLELAIELLNLELKIKETRETIKEIKAEARANGVAVKEVLKALKILKEHLKETKNDDQSVNDLVLIFEKDMNIINSLTILTNNLTK